MELLFLVESMDSWFFHHALLVLVLDARGAEIEVRPLDRVDPQGLSIPVTVPIQAKVILPMTHGFATDKHARNMNQSSWARFQTALQISRFTRSVCRPHTK